MRRTKTQILRETRQKQAEVQNRETLKQVREGGKAQFLLDCTRNGIQVLSNTSQWTIFTSIETLLAWNRKWIVQEKQRSYGLFTETLEAFDYENDNYVKYKIAFADHFGVLTVLDNNQWASQRCVEIKQTQLGRWEVTVGFSNRYVHWTEDSLEEALKAGMEYAKRINDSEDPGKELGAIYQEAVNG